MAAKPKILILDEPLVGVDEAGQQQFAELSRRLHAGLQSPSEGPRDGTDGDWRRESKLTLVIVSHDIRAIAASCSRVACLNQTIHYHDSPAGLTEEVLARGVSARDFFGDSLAEGFARRTGESFRKEFAAAFSDADALERK